MIEVPVEVVEDVAQFAHRFPGIAAGKGQVEGDQGEVEVVDFELCHLRSVEGLPGVDAEAAGGVGFGGEKQGEGVAQRDPGAVPEAVVHRAGGVSTVADCHWAVPPGSMEVKRFAESRLGICWAARIW